MNDLDRFDYAELHELATKLYHGANKLWTSAETMFVQASDTLMPALREARYSAYQIIQAAAKEQSELHSEICAEMRARREARHG